MADNFDLNQFLGDMLKNPFFWICLILIVAVVLIWKLKRPNKPEFKAEPLAESLKKDLRPRMEKQGRKIKSTFLMQGFHRFGKVHRWTTGQIEYHSRELTPLTEKERRALPYNEMHKTETSKLVKKEMDVIYITVTGSLKAFLYEFFAFLPFLQKKFEPDYYVLNEKFVTHYPDRKLFMVDPAAHIYPYGTIWLCDRLSQNYMTELEARRTQEFEAETHINTLNRWTFYEAQQSGKIVLKEKDAELEQKKWDSAKDRGSES